MKTESMINDLILAITMEDVIESVSSYDGNILTDEQKECLRDRQRTFEKAMEWGIMEHVWNVVHDTAHEILAENEMPVVDA